MKKRILILGVGIILLFLLWQSIAVWPLLRPDKHFPYAYEDSSFLIQSDLPADSEVTQLLPEIQTRLQAIPIYDTSRQYYVYLCYKPSTYALLATTAKRPPQTQGFNLHPINYSVINISFIDQIYANNDEGHRYSILEGNLEHVIAHEITHELIARQLGFWKVRNSPSWKLEGYCEYAASLSARQSNPAYSFVERFQEFSSGKFKDIAPGRQFYIRSALIVEYLLDISKLSFEEFMEQDLAENSTWEELKAWHRSQ